MLTISKPLNAGQAQTYHAKEFTSPDQNYWTQGDVNFGEWQGKMAESFGLSGHVGATHFARLSEGQHPITGEQLVRHRFGNQYTTSDGATVKPVEHRAGWDATFSAPKSVSLTALVGGDKRVREAHRQAVSFALDELERYTQARIGGNNAAETTGKFLAAKFEHDTARPVDGYAAPQLHTHAVIFNMTDRDGGIRALQARSLFDTQQFATAVYQSELTFRLRDLGYEIEPGRSGAPEIKGYTREYLEASSPRSQQIRDYLEKTGYQGPEAAQIAAHDTRDNKAIHSTTEVLAAHYKVAAAHGHQAEAIIAAARQRQQIQPLERVLDAPSRAQEAVTYAKERGFEREAVSDERLLMRDALRRGMGDITYPEVRRNFDRRVDAGEFQSVAATKHATGRTFTTPETIAMERSAVRSLRLGQDATEPIMRADAAVKQAASRAHLNEGQRKAIAEILSSHDRVHGLQGLAGTGKTTTLSVIRQGAERSGYAVEGFAPTSRAASQLREAGVSADTLQGFLKRGGGQEQTAGDPASRHLYMLDESSLASTRQMRDFLNKIGSQDRVLVIGDTRQHQGVDAGKPFEQMQDAGMRTSQLDKIVRQQDPALRSAVEKLSQNETAIGVAMLQQQGRVTQVENREERIAVIAKAYAARPENTIIVSPDNVSRREINRAVRIELQESGRISTIDQFLPTLVPRSELTGADRQWAARYHEGDVIHYSTGSKDLRRGSYATVASVDPQSNRLTVRREDGREITYDPKRLQGVSAYQEIGRDFSKGDRLQFTAPSRELGVANRDLATIEKIHEGIVTVRLDGRDQTLTFDSAKMRHFDHGYAVTSHSSQGVTAERVLVNMDTRAHPDLIDTRFAYVSVSRASHEAQIYTNDAAALGQKLSHDASKTSAIDFHQQQPNPPQKREDKKVGVERQQARRPEDTPREIIYRPIDHERHYGPLNKQLHPEDAFHFGWKAENGTIQTYQHAGTQRHIHIDGPSGQFYDQHTKPVTQHAALDHAIGVGRHHAPEPAKVQEAVQQQRVVNGIGFGL